MKEIKYHEIKTNLTTCALPPKQFYDEWQEIIQGKRDENKSQEKPWLECGSTIVKYVDACPPWLLMLT